MSFAPVVLFVYNRADHFEKTFDALSKCAEAKETILYIFSDGPKNEKAVERVSAVRKAISSAKSKNLFKDVIITESEKNKGLAASVIDGVTSVVNEYGKVIVVEDDCAASEYFLNYMNKCLDFFQDDNTVGSISGYTPPIDIPDDYSADIFLATRSCSWGWATWKDRWLNVDWDPQAIKFFYQKPALIKKLNENGSDRFLRLYRQTKGNSSSWSVRFGAHLIKNGLYTIYPRYSYIKNIGCDESGIHSKSEDSEKVKVDITKAIKDPEIKKVEVDTRIQKKMKKFYSDGFLSDMKRFLYTSAIVMKNRI